MQQCRMFVGECAIRCRAYAKALRYKERELLELKFLPISVPSSEQPLEGSASANALASGRSAQETSKSFVVLESLLSLYSKLQQPEATFGVLHFASKHGFKPKASWYESFYIRVHLYRYTDIQKTAQLSSPNKLCCSFCT